MELKAAMVLSGCGFLDGSEIHESCALLLACADRGIQVDGFAPVNNQQKVVNHIAQDEENEVRSVLKESARIMRGNVKPLGEYRCEQYDVLLFPGGYGAVQNLCNFAQGEGPHFQVCHEVESAILTSYEKKMPMAFLCISPMIAARVLGHYGPKLTVGNDKGLLSKLAELGAKPVSTESRQIVWDAERRVGSAPAYMFQANILDVYIEATYLLNEMVKVLGDG